MDLSDVVIHSFVLKIWREGTAEEAGHVTWRGQITHVSSGNRRYVESLRAINDFIADYLEEMGVRVSAGRRLRRWLRR